VHNNNNHYIKFAHRNDSVEVLYIGVKLYRIFDGNRRMTDLASWWLVYRYIISDSNVAIIIRYTVVVASNHGNRTCLPYRCVILYYNNIISHWTTTTTSRTGGSAGIFRKCYLNSNGETRRCSRCRRQTWAFSLV